MPDSDSFADLFFISHPDDSDFTRRLAAHLEAQDIGCNNEMASAAKDASRSALQDALLRAHIVAIALSPESAASQLCNELIEFAVAQGKRFLTLIINEDIKVDVHPAIAQNPYIFFREDEALDEGVKRLLPFLELDDHRRLHTELLLRAHRWEASDGAPELLLPPDRVDEAREWLAQGAHLEPKPAPLQVEYIHASRRQPPRKRRSAKPLLFVLALSLLLVAAVAIAREIESRETAAAEQIAERQERQAGTQNAISAAMTATEAGDADARLLDRVAATSAGLRDALLADLDSRNQRATESAASIATAAAEATRYAANAEATNTAILRADLAARAMLAGAERALESGDSELALALAWEAAGKLREPELALPILTRAAALRPLIALDDAADIALHPGAIQIAVLPHARDRVSVFDGETGAPLHEIRQSDGAITSMAYSRDGAWLVVGADDGAIEIYDSADGTALQQWQADENRLDALALAGSADSESSLMQFDAETLRQVDADDPLQDAAGSLEDQLDSEMVKAVEDEIAATVTSAHLLDDRVISATSDNRLIAWSLNDGALLREIGIASDALAQVDIDDGGRLAAALTEDGAVYVWRLDRDAIGMPRALPATAQLNRAGDAVLMIDDAGLRLEAIETHATLLQMSDVKVARMNRSGTHFAAHSGDSISLHDAADGELLASWTVNDNIDAVYIAPSGERLLLSEGETLRLLRVAGEALLLNSVGMGGLLNASFAAESDAILTLHTDGVALWDGRNAAPVSVYALGLPADSFAAGDISMTVSAVGERLTFLARLEDGIVSLSQITPGAAAHATTFVDIAAADLSADGATLALLSEDGAIRVMDPATGSVLAQVQTQLQSASQLQFIARLNRLYAAADHSLLVYDSESGLLLSRHQQSHPIAGLSLNADGSVALTIDSKGRAWLWQIESPAEIMRRIETEIRPRALTCGEREAYLALPLCD